MEVINISPYHLEFEQNCLSLKIILNLSTSISGNIASFPSAWI